MRFILVSLAIAVSSCGSNRPETSTGEVTIKLPPPSSGPGFGKAVSRIGN
jgi:hypothetical protein